MNKCERPEGDLTQLGGAIAPRVEPDLGTLLAPVPIIIENRELGISLNAPCMAR